MKTIRYFVLALVLGLAGLGTGIHAEDIDIYADTASNSGVPNVLFVIDTGANFSSNAPSGAACASYSVAAGGGAPSLGNTGGGVEQCALVDSIAALPDGTVNIGLLVNNNNNFGRDDRSASDVSYHEKCEGKDGGCVIRNLTLMSKANKINLINFIKSWSITNTSSTEFNVRSGGDATGSNMQEAWAYYNGKEGMSGKNYPTSIINSGCQRNFIIFIGNSLTNSGGPGDSATSRPENGTTGLMSTQMAATSEQKVKISDTVAFKNKTCGVDSIVASTNASNWSENWADELARLMNQQDGSITLDGLQQITTYTIGVINNTDNGCKADYPALLTTMAAYGGGKYFQTSSSNDLKDALLSVLNEIQAVNSVFSSASLPVSVNAQGTYLNQIFMGMFRPDASANPRWLGNLKQYQFTLTGDNPSTATLQLADSTGAAALSSAGTGFFSPSAISFWTSKDTSVAPDNAGGFFINEPNPTGHDHFDSPDGELVERGGVAQQLRKESLGADFAAAAATRTNPRRLYTYCPSDSFCDRDLTASSNAFSKDNAGISAAQFGTSSIKIASIERTGTTALVTTVGNHGFTAGTSSVTISNATPSDYNVTQTISAPVSANTFTITGLNDYPTTPSAGIHTIAAVSASAVSVSAIERSVSSSAGNDETVKVQTAGHGFVAGSTVTIQGTTPSNYSGNFTIALPGTTDCPAATCFTYFVPIYPTTPAANIYTVQEVPYTRSISSLEVTGTSSKITTATTSSEHGFFINQNVTISGTAKHNGPHTITAVVSSTKFSFTTPGGAKNETVGSVQNNPQVLPLATLDRTSNANSTTAKGTVSSVSVLGNEVNQTKVVNIVKASGSSTTEQAYVGNNLTITCVNAGCTEFTYPISTTPATTITGTITASPPTTSPVTVGAGSITRTAAGLATVTGVTTSRFLDQQTVNIANSGAVFPNEEQYNGQWRITCTVLDCSSFTFGPVQISPAVTATGSNMQVYAPGVSPDKDLLVKWVRGEDNFGDELGPNKTIPSITVRPSIHGDVLHSRPVVINYGDSSRGLVVYYGANDGVFRAVNGSQTAAIGEVAAGNELWGLVLPEHFGKLNRQRVNSPELKLATTALSSAQPKDYFVDGSVGTYQKLKADGTIDKAYLYLTMRRGGRFIYALDVSEPTIPKFMWKINAGDVGFEELGQTWSRPRLTLVKGYSTGSGASTVYKPVLVFGGGYDPAEDAEPPTANTMGRGIFVVDAVTGARVWSATYATSSACTGSSTQAACGVQGMNWAIPSDISFVDRNNDGLTDRFYVGDVGGNVWRVDLEPDGVITPDQWKTTKLAAVGCGSATCVSGVTPRKFFYPPSVVSVGVTGVVGSYDVVMLGSGDREHPLQSSASYSVPNRFYVLKDTFTGTVAGTSTIAETGLFNAGVVNPPAGTANISYDGTLGGFYLTFATGEKAVNASVTLRGTTYFGTNRPTPPSASTCRSNLGEAKGYALDPFKGSFGATIFDGGGLPPSPTTGIVSISFTYKKNDTDTNTTVMVPREFCVGCGSGGTGADSKSALGAVDPATKVPKNMQRSYWFKR